MLVYVAYGLLVLHVTFGILQAELSTVYVIAVGIGFITVLTLHLIAGLGEIPADRDVSRKSKFRKHEPGITALDGFVHVCSVNDILENRARIVCLGGERVAIFKYDGKISAVSNVCQHQNGPLGEGKILDGCITCPWHGYQYRPETGASPPPFVEKVPTFNVRVESGKVLVHPLPNPPGVRVEPALIDPDATMLTATSTRISTETLLTQETACQHL